MNMRRVVLQFVALTTACAIASTAEPKRTADQELRQSATKVSIVQLLANPKAYNGRLVWVHGFINLEFEGSAIYLHKEDFEYRLTTNGFWLNASRCTGLDQKPFKTGYASVVGTFDAADHGHLGMWSGAITAKICESRPVRRTGPVRFK